MRNDKFYFVDDIESGVLISTSTTDSPGKKIFPEMPTLTFIWHNSCDAVDIAKLILDRQTVDFPMTHPVLSQKKAINILSILAWRKIDWFITLSRFLRADDQTLDTGFKILKVLLEASKLTGTEQD